MARGESKFLVFSATSTVCGIWFARQSSSITCKVHVQLDGSTLHGDAPVFHVMPHQFYQFKRPWDAPASKNTAKHVTFLQNKKRNVDLVFFLIVSLLPKNKSLSRCNCPAQRPTRHVCERGPTTAESCPCAAGTLLIVGL